jgi:hypothetical protein
MNKHRILRFVAHPIVIALVITTTNLITPRLRADETSAPQKPLVYVDLQPKANQKLSDSLHGFGGNDLAELPKGEQSFGGVKFKVEDGYLRLSGNIETGNQPKKPEKLEGIAIGKSIARVHILHGTGYGAYGSVGDPLFVKDGTLIGEYRLHYEDGSTESIPIAYGQDVRDWWTWEKPAEVTRGKIAWTGKNSFSRQQNQSIHLYLTTWSNPHPEKKVSSLDYICTGTSAASPFCIAISIEEK